MAALLDSCQRVTESTATLRWVDPEPILAAGVRPWSDLPIWVSPGHPFRPLHETDSDKAHAAGLHCRAVEATVADTWAWLLRTLRFCSTEQLARFAPAGRREAWLDPEVEARILARAGGPER